MSGTKVLIKRKYKKNSNPLSDEMCKDISKALCNKGYKVNEAYLIEDGNIIKNGKEYETLTIQFLIKIK